MSSQLTNIPRVYQQGCKKPHAAPSLQLLREKRGRPQMPWPLVQPLPTRVPMPTATPGAGKDKVKNKVKSNKNG